MSHFAVDMRAASLIAGWLASARIAPSSLKSPALEEMRKLANLPPPPQMIE
jgi:hypothetical protein